MYDVVGDHVLDLPGSLQSALHKQVPACLAKGYSKIFTVITTE